MVVKLTPLPEGLLTSYVVGLSGRTRMLNGALAPDEKLVTTPRVGSSSSLSWSLAPRACEDYVALDAAVVKAKGARLRLTEAHRPTAIQSDARRKYETWVAAGRPASGTRGYDPRTMKAAYVAPAGRSNHGWGGSVDVDVEALEFPGTGRGTDAALEKFWLIAAEHGWSPIINEPHVGMSEAWHFDHLPPELAPVKAAFREAGYGDAYGHVALCVSTVMGTYSDLAGANLVRYLQARLNLGGFFCGPVDGVAGKNTRAALKAAGVKSKTTSEQIAELDALRVAYDVLEAL